jgi:hypothetical protein
MSDVSRETEPIVDDEALVRYLIGAMTDEQAEPLDELSVADADFEARLRALEYDLLDGYVNGELAGETLDQFRSHYLSSPSGLAKVDIAGALRGYRRDRVRDARTPAPIAARMRARWWTLAAAAVLALVIGGLAVDNVRLRRQAIEASERQAALELRERQLRDTLSRQQSEMTATSRDLGRARDALAAARAGATGQPSTAPRVLAFVLLPATRGSGEIPAIAIAASTNTVILRLQLDGKDYRRYDVAIKDANTGRIVWRSRRLRAASAGNRTILPASLPANVLRSGAYAAEVTGIPERGQPEPLDRYPFRVVLQ